MHDNKFIQAVLKELLQHGTKAIKKRSLQSKNDVPDQILENRIIEIFSQLLDEDFDRNSFKQKIMSKKLPSKPSAKKVVQLLYNFIYAVETDGKKINTGQIKVMSEDIMEMINKLSRKSRFFLFKTHLRTKVLQLTKIKKLYFSSAGSETEKFKDSLIACLDMFEKETTLNVQNTIRVLESFNKNISLGMEDESLKSSLNTFFEQLYIRCEKFINEQSYMKNPEQINVGMRGIISEINILSGQLDLHFNTSNLDKCLKLCRKLRYLSKSSKEKFDYNEKRRENKAYSLKSFKKVVSLHLGAIDKANAFLDSNGFSVRVPHEILSEYNKIISDENIKILDKTFYGQQVEKMRMDVQKALVQAASESIFGADVPTSDQILDKIVKLF